MSKLKKPWHGVDVSDHQGIIDWDSLIKEQQIDFAIIRTSWGTEGLDKQYKNNIEACIRLGIPFGVYHYSYTGDGIEKYNGQERRALLHDQAISEAKFFLNTIAPYEFYLGLPVFMDIEDDSRNKYLGQLTNEELNFVVTTFCDFMGSRNYLTGIYANKNWLDNKLNYFDLSQGRDDVRGVYDVWVAEWIGNNDGEQHANKSTYKQVHTIWQYTSQKKTNCTTGTKNLDCNLCYVDYPKLLETNGLNGRWAEGFIDLIKTAPNNRWLQIEKGNETTKYLVGTEPFWIFKDSNGGLVKGWIASGNKWYFTRPDIGVMIKGLQQIDGDIYYLDYTTGAMASNCWLDTVNGIRYARPNGKFAKNTPGQAFIKWRINGEDITFDPAGGIYEDKAMLAQCKYAPECLDANGNVINLVCDPTPIKVVKPEVVEPSEPEPDDDGYIYNCVINAIDNTSLKLLREINNGLVHNKDKIEFPISFLIYNDIKYLPCKVSIKSKHLNDEHFIEKENFDVKENDVFRYIVDDEHLIIDIYYKEVEPVKPTEVYIYKVYEIIDNSSEKHLISSKIFQQGDSLYLEIKNKLDENLKLEYVKIYQYDKTRELFVEVNSKDLLVDNKIVISNDFLPATDIEIVAHYSHVKAPVEPDKPIVPDTPNQSNKWVVALVTAILAGIVWLISLFA